MSKTTSYLVCLLLPLLTVSCGTLSSSVEVPMMQQKGDAMVSAGFSYPLGVCVSGAYSPVNHFALQADAELSFQSPSHGYYPFNTHLSLGYYHKFGQNWVLENYYGGGYGQYSTRLSYDPRHFRYGLDANAFTQINFGAVNLIAHGEVGVAVKAAYHYSDWTDLSKDLTSSFIGHSLVLTPVFFCRFGWEHVRIGLQFQGNHNVGLIGNYQYQDPFNVLLSVMYRF